MRVPLYLWTSVLALLLAGAPLKATESIASTPAAAILPTTPTAESLTSTPPALPSGPLSPAEESRLDHLRAATLDALLPAIPFRWPGDGGTKQLHAPLVFIAKDADGKSIRGSELPPALAQLKKDLKEKDITATFEAEDITVWGDEVDKGPQVVFTVVCLPEQLEGPQPSRRLYLAMVAVRREASFGGNVLGLGADKYPVTTAVFTAEPVLGSVDEAADLEKVRAAVKKLAQRVIDDGNGKK